METNLPAVINILNSFPGNLVYYLILIYSITACFLNIWTGYRANNQPIPKYVFAGLGVLLMASFLPLIYTLIPDTGVWSTPETFALLERTSLTLLMIWAAWLWLYPRPGRLETIASVLFSLVIPGVVTVVAFFNPGKPDAFNGTLADLTWHFLILLSVMFFSMLILRKQPSFWTYGIGMMMLMLAGFTVSLALITQKGNISGLARLGMLCAFPLLPLLGRRFDVSEQPAQVPTSFTKAMDQAISHPVPDEINAWLSAVANLDLTRQQEAIARMLCQTLDAQGCAFVQLADVPGVLTLSAGYDMANQTWIEPNDLPGSDYPRTLNSVIAAELSIIRQSVENFMELSRYSSLLKIDNVSSIALLPIKNHGAPWGSAILIRSGQSASFLMESLQQFTPTAAALSHIFRNNETAIRERQELIRLSEELDMLQSTNQTLQSNLDTLRISAVQVLPEQNTFQMLTLQQASESEIDRLRNENKLLLETIAEKEQERTAQPDMEVDEKTGNELITARAEITRLQNLLQDSRRHLKEIQKQSTISQASVEGLRKFNTLITELRRPLSTITGYVDLLVAGENSPEARAGSQASMENLKTSLDRLRLIMNDLTDLNVLNSGVIDMEPELMDLGHAIDQAISTVSVGFMEKDISIKLDLPAHMPDLFTYHDALKKVIIYLLQNAGKVTPEGGSVELRVEVHPESAEPYLMIEVVDHGGGIAPEYLAKVFTPIEQLEEKQIPGLGELNGGMAASKTLVEAHGGRIWVDSEPGISTIFSVLLPIQSENAVK
jgi:signal transduction histidine kinase